MSGRRCKGFNTGVTREDAPRCLIKAMAPLDTLRGPMDESLWSAHVDELTRYAAVLVGPADARDVVVDAFLRTGLVLADDSVANPRAYLFRAVTNTAHNHRRSRSRRWERDLVAVAESSVGSDVERVDVMRAVAGLSVRQRAVVYLAYWEDLTERAIAETLGLSVGTVRRHLHRAQHKLREALQ